MKKSTLQTLQDDIHVLYETSDVETPTEGDDDWNLRTALLRIFIEEWEQADMWSELTTNLSDAADGTKTTTDGTEQYATPTNFAFVMGNVTVTHTDGVKEKFKFIPIRNVQLYEDDLTTKYFFVSGNKKSGYYINFRNGSYGTGDTIEYQYYADATYPVEDTDSIEMSIPLFVVKKVVSKLHEADGEGSRASKMDTEANGLLSQMIAINNGTPWNQSDRVQEGDQSTSGFGD